MTLRACNYDQRGTFSLSKTKIFLSLEMLGKYYKCPVKFLEYRESWDRKFL
jgi:hypothetical protein